jgi:hypothetical protein
MKCKYLTILAALSLLIFVSHTASSEEIEVSYKSFYSHVRKLNNDDTKDLQFAFGFMHIEKGRLCKINSARISTQKQQIPLEVSPEYRFTVQSEKALRLANAMVVVDIEEAANKCDMSVQLETKPDFLKTVKGLTIQFADQNLSAALNGEERIVAGMLNISEERINEINRLELPSAPLRITAQASR